jgi:choice-of-anchor A domain-containing protein
MFAKLRGAVLAASTLASFACSGSAQATNYNVLVFGDFTNTNADVEGALAAGGNINLSSFAVGSALGNSANGENTLVAGKSITFNNGQLDHGNAVAGTAVSGNFNDAHGSKIVGNAMDFAAAKRLYDGYSTTAAAMAVTGTTTYYNWGGLFLTGTQSGRNVFDVDGSTIGVLNTLNLSIPTDSYAVINWTGSTASFANMGFNVNGVDSSQILFNFPDATSLTLTGVGFDGSILAPSANVKFSNGQMNGQLIAQSLFGTGGGEFHNKPLNVDAFFPSSASEATPEPESWALMILGFGAIGAALRRHLAARTTAAATPDTLT